MYMISLAMIRLDVSTDIDDSNFQVIRSDGLSITDEVMTKECGQ